MTVHYHGTPITPISALYELSGRHFCVSHIRPDDVRRCHEIGQGVMLDNGAFSKWKRGVETDWPAYYDWCDRWLHYPTTWAIPPDVIDAPSQEQDGLLNEWPHGRRQAAPVWHMDEPVSRLLRLCDQSWNRVCIGSTAEYRNVLSEAWQRRMDEVWNSLLSTFGRTPPVHMLRGMQCAGRRWPLGCNAMPGFMDTSWHRATGNGRMTLRPVPVDLEEAAAFITNFHRHCKPARGWKFGVGASDGAELVGVAVLGRTVAGALHDSATAEVTRCCARPGAPRGTPSFLYAALWRAWRALGGRRLVTYTLQSESGASLRGAGAKIFAELQPNDPAKWQNRPGREWQPVVGQAKFRWEWVE